MRRHDLVYLRPGAAFATPCAAPDSAAWQAAADWLAAGRPLVHARQAGGGTPLLLGLALPLSHARKRLTLQVDRSAVARVTPALPVSQCLHCLPPDSARILAGLANELQQLGARLGVYGSLAWEALSGEAYRHASSDIDIICDLAERADYRAVLASLQRAADRLPCRLDGELRFPDGKAVAWQELAMIEADGKQQVLVKDEQNVALIPPSQLFAQLLTPRTEMQPC